MHIIIKLIDLTPDAIGELYAIEKRCQLFGDMFEGATGTSTQNRPIEILGAKQEKAQPAKPPNGFNVEIKLSPMVLLSLPQESKASGFKSHTVFPALATFKPLLELIQKYYQGALSDENKTVPEEK